MEGIDATVGRRGMIVGVAEAVETEVGGTRECAMIDGTAVGIRDAGVGVLHGVDEGIFYGDDARGLFWRGAIGTGIGSRLRARD